MNSRKRISAASVVASVALSLVVFQAAALSKGKPAARPDYSQYNVEIKDKKIEFHFSDPRSDLSTPFIVQVDDLCTDSADVYEAGDGYYISIRNPEIVSKPELAVTVDDINQLRIYDASSTPRVLLYKLKLKKRVKNENIRFLVSDGRLEIKAPFFSAAEHRPHTDPQLMKF